MDFVSGPDFPTGGVLVDNRETIAHAYATGRGSFRLRAKIEVEREKGGGWHLLVHEIPYGVQKGQLIEQIADLIARQKLPILADVRDESDDGGADRAGAAVADGRSGAAAGKPVQADRAGDALPAEPQRARQDADAGGDEPEAGAARLAGVPDRGAGPAVARTGSARSTTGWSCSTASWSRSSTSTG